VSCRFDYKARKNARRAAVSVDVIAGARAAFEGAWTAVASGLVRRRTSSSVRALPSLK